MLEREEFVPTRMPILAGDRVRFTGEPVAMVVADDAYRAEDAAELVEVDWDPQPAVASIEAATAAGAPRLHEPRQLPGRPADVRRRAAPADLRRGGADRQRDLRQRPGRRAAAGGTRLPGRMGRPRRPAGHARLHPGAAPGPVRRRPGAEPPGALRPGDRPGRRRRVRAEVRGGPGGGGGGGGRAAAAAAGALGRGPAGEPDRRLPRPRAALPGHAPPSTPTAGSSAWTPRSTATPAPTRCSRSPARSSR